jgi:SAM-dependent methyltransferase
VIGDALRLVACPVCLEEAGCDRCARPGAGHAACETGYRERAACACGGPDKPALAQRDASLACPCCGASYAIHPEGYLDLVPRAAVGALTQYADHEFHERLEVVDAPPLLSAGIKAAVMRQMLDWRSGDRVLDLGCGAGKFALFAKGEGAAAVGLDVAPFFLPRALREVELVLGDLRRQPFRKGAIPTAYSLDVLEHLDEEGVLEVLVEARRTIGPGGRLFVYTHAMESSRLARFQRATNRLARRLGERGFIDHEREALRKSDHRNAIRSHEHFDELCARAGLRVAERRYYNVVFKAVVEDLGLRLFEQWRRRRARRRPAGGDGGQAAPPAAVGARRPPRGVGLALGRALTWLLKLDVVLFGSVRTGPFFGRLEPER